MKVYLDLLSTIMTKGVDRSERTGIGTRSLFGHQMRFDLNQGFPLVTTKKVPLKSIIYELLWFLRGDTNIRYLVQNGVNIWNEWPYQVYLERNNLSDKYPRYSDSWKEQMKEFVEKIKSDDTFAEQWGDIGPGYGRQWIQWEGANGQTVNQIKEVINLLKNDPSSRRILVSGWNAAQIQEMIKTHYSAPPPCHTLFQFHLMGDRLSCQLYMRSNDAFLGTPFNIASYALLTMMVAQVMDLKLGEYIHTNGDVHIYLNHFDQVKEQLIREPRPLPKMKINPKVKDIFQFKYEDFELEGYDPHPAIKAQIAV